MKIGQEVYHEGKKAVIIWAYENGYYEIKKNEYTVDLVEESELSFFDTNNRHKLA